MSLLVCADCGDSVDKELMSLGDLNYLGDRAKEYDLPHICFDCDQKRQGKLPFDLPTPNPPTVFNLSCTMEGDYCEDLEAVLSGICSQSQEIEARPFKSFNDDGVHYWWGFCALYDDRDEAVEAFARVQSLCRVIGEPLNATLNGVDSL